jgi:hypothetical protein
MPCISLGGALEIMTVAAGKDISMPDGMMSRERNVKAQYVCVAGTIVRRFRPRVNAAIEDIRI